MAAPGFRTSGPNDPRDVAAPAWPKYDLMDLPALLWRERFLMVAVFTIIVVLGFAAALAMKTTYPAYSSVLVRLGQEYVYEPRAGDAGRGAVPDPDQMIQSEMEILGSAQLKYRVIERLGLSTIYPKLADKYAKASPSEKRKILAVAVRGMSHDFATQSAPGTPVIKVSFAHADPQTSALVLNTLLEEYLIYRRSVLIDPTSPALEQQRRAFETRLAQADMAYEGFLSSNRIGDFASEKASLSQLQAQIEQQKYQTDNQLQERVGRLSTLERQLAQVAPEVGLFRDVSNAASEKLVTLKVQREDLLSRYRPDSKPVQELNTQIAQMEAAVASGRAQGDGARRFGANPVHQTLQTEKIQLTAEVAALRQSQATLASQLDQLTERRMRLTSLEPQFQALSLDRDVLQASVRDFTQKEEQTRAAQEIAARTNDNIRVVEAALPPTQGKSLKKPLAMLTILLAGFSALCAGLLRMVTRPGLPTARAAARTLDLPILGAAALKAH
jgi:uncharacterized protein involved in exopolysaccharide biosynthesis